MIFGNRNWVNAHPIATKRFLRATFKAAEFCSAEPQTAARQLVNAGFTEHYDYALDTIQELPYQLWREYDAEDTMRFYSLWLHEVGIIKSTPQEIITKGTEWRFLNELKRELKA